ncbi:MAG: hypothetical protein V3S01_08130 [Dehalococcoidia bacterium]
MVITLTREDIVELISLALKDQAPSGVTGVNVRFNAKSLGDDVDVTADVLWLGVAEPDVKLCRCTHMTPCNPYCPCGFGEGAGACGLCGTTGPTKERPLLRLVPKDEA